MATETYKYFIASSNLRSEYGGGLIANNGDTAEVTKETLCLRYICKQLDIPANHTRFLAQIGTATGGIVYIRVPDILYSAISSYLTASELLTVVSSAPTGFALDTTTSQFQPRARGKNVIIRGDSISAGLGTTTGDTRDIYASQAINLISGETLVNIDTVNYRERASKNYSLFNISLGGSSWGNTDPSGGAGGSDAYPLREDLAFNQRTKTMCLNPREDDNFFFYWLGTNDLAYDLTLSGADVWEKVVTRIGAFRTEFPNVKLAIGTIMKRSENATLNGRINDLNVLIRANYASIGIDAIADFEALVPQVNLTTGNTANTTYYTDGVHVTNATHALLGAVFKDVILSLL